MLTILTKSVTANPLIPVPYWNSIKAASSVVRLESKIVQKALSNRLLWQSGYFSLWSSSLSSHKYNICIYCHGYRKKESRTGQCNGKTKERENRKCEYDVDYKTYVSNEPAKLVIYKSEKEDPKSPMAKA